MAPGIASLTRGTLLRMALRVGLVIVAGTGFAYVYFTMTGQAGEAVPMVLALGIATLALQLLAVHHVLRRRVTQPLAALIDAAQKVAGSNLEARVPVRGDDELACLGQAFNTMTEQFASQRRTLAETVERFERMVEGSTSALWEFNPATHDFYLAPRFRDLLGWSDVANPFSYWESMIHPDDHDPVMDAFRAHMETHEPFQVEYRLRRADGSYLWVHVRGRCIHDQYGGLALMSGSLTDISKRKKAEAELEAYRSQLEQLVERRTAEARDSELRFRTLAEATSEGILVHADDRVLDCNGVMEVMFGCNCPCEGEPRIACNRTVGDLFAPQCRDEAMAAMAAGAPGPLEFLGMRADGSTFPIEVRTKRAVKNDTAILVTAIGDRTEQKALNERLTRLADEAQAASRAKSDFLATMSHEIRTPMNGIIGMAQLLKDTPLSAEQRDHVETLCASGEALQTLLNDILDLSKLESGRLELDRRPFGLRALVAQVADLFRSRAEEKGLELAWTVDPAVPDNVVGDPLRLRQVLTNLVGNAVKFTELGGVRLFAEARDTGDTGCTVMLRVADTGIGIPEDTLARLFTPFGQGDASIAGRFGGTGLGLAICKRLVELMDGRLGVDSHAGEGSVFWFELPLAIDPTTPQAPVPAPIGEPARPLAILLAEDNPVNQKVVEAFLTRRGHEVTVVGNGADAVSTAAGRRFNAILMDMQMPV
ncbi:MAG TPA: ATP-binding protein, partial [Candidatus Omnitrophota bacterium]|nr:ATP-binding protein [Candidatus Omnitrophota bacterium]